MVWRRVLGLLAWAVMVDGFGFASLQPLTLQRKGARTCTISMAGFGAKAGAKGSKVNAYFI